VVNKYSDIALTCRQCGKEFLFSEDEQEFYKTKGYTVPHRCKECRLQSRQRQAVACSRCGSQFVEETPVYCAACLVTIQLEFAQKVQGLQSTIAEAKAKIEAVEAEKTNLLYEAGERVKVSTELEKRLHDTPAELEKTLKSRATLEWLEPALNSLGEKLSIIENNQNHLIEAWLKAVQRKEKTGSFSLLEVIKGFFHRRLPAQG
jgi:hypothetical protein